MKENNKVYRDVYPVRKLQSNMFSVIYISCCTIDVKLDQRQKFAKMAVQCILTITVFQLAIIGCCAVSGIIWLKQKQEFVQLFSIPQFATLQKENLAKRRALEMRDMKNEVVRGIYYEVRSDSKDINSYVSKFANF